MPGDTFLDLSQATIDAFWGTVMTEYAVTRRIEMSSDSLKRWLSTSEQRASLHGLYLYSSLQPNSNNIKRRYIYRVRQPVNIPPWSSKVGFMLFIFFCAEVFVIFMTVLWFLLPWRIFFQSASYLSTPRLTGWPMRREREKWVAKTWG
jgi:hypothetical protein